MQVSGRGPSAVVVSDLDGTLLDKETYSFDEARPALAALAERGIPVVLVSSKTRAEIEPLREELVLDDPFVVENGGAAYLPRGYLEEEVGTRDPSGGYDVLRWGTPYEEVVSTLREAREITGAELKGFSDLDAEQVATLTGLSLYEARRAKVREFDEPFWIEGEKDERSDKALAILASRLTLTRGGRFYHIMGNCDKGRAVQALLHHFRDSHGELASAGLGDARNDLPFLQIVDRAYVVAGAGGRPDPELVTALPGARAVGVAPRGWTEGVMDFLSWLDEGRDRRE